MRIIILVLLALFAGAEAHAQTQTQARYYCDNPPGFYPQQAICNVPFRLIAPGAATESSPLPSAPSPVRPGSAFLKSPDGKITAIHCGTPPALTDFANDLAVITPVAGGPVAASAKINLPDFSIAKQGPDEACRTMMLEAQFEAINRGELFQSVQSQPDSPVTQRPKDETADFLIWMENGRPMIAYRHGPRMQLPFVTVDLAAWIKAVAQQIPKAKEQAEWHNNALLTLWFGGAPYYAFNGIEYSDLSSVSSVVSAAFRDTTSFHVDRPIAKHAHIVLSPEGISSGSALHTADGLSLYCRLVSLWRAEVIKRSNLFESVTVEESGELRPTYPGTDIVFWQAKGSALGSIVLEDGHLQAIEDPKTGMRMISITGDKYESVFAMAKNDPADWGEAVRAAVAKSKQ